MKILVVDDTEANRRLLAWMLEDEGHSVQEAGNGEEAVALFKDTQPDLVLMDVMMPIMDGYEATQAIKEYLGDKHVPIIFLTALSDDASLTKCLAIGGDDFLSKPINEQVLQAKIKAHSRIKDLNEQLNRQNAKLTKLHQLTEREHRIAKTVFESALASSKLDDPNIRHYISPAATFNGDLLLAAYSPTGGLYTLMADFTGHGLPAAIGAVPLSQVFFDAAQQGASVSSIARELNRSLERFLPDDMFAAAAIAELNAEATRLTLWMGGMPDALLTDQQGKLLRTIQSAHMPLGILEDHEFERDPFVLEVNSGDRLYLYTDGIPEAVNFNGIMYGEDRLLKHFSDGGNDPFKSVIQDVTWFTDSKGQVDDITFLELTCNPVQFEQEKQVCCFKADQALPWDLTMTLTAHELRDGAYPISQITDMISNAPGIEAHKDYLHTILTELFANALEHGILQLDSRLKCSEQGYLDYYEQRQQKLAQLNQGTLSIRLQFRVEGPDCFLSMQLQDSGCGFDVENRSPCDDNDAFGRGIDLIESLCDEVVYSNGGSRVDVRYRIGC